MKRLFATVAVVALVFLGGCRPAVPIPAPKAPACYLAPGPYHMVARLMAAEGCPKNKVPAVIVQSMDVEPGQLKCGLVTAPLASGAVLLMKVKTDMVVGRLAVTDGKCHIEYGILMLPKAEKRR